MLLTVNGKYKVPEDLVGDDKASLDFMRELKRTRGGGRFSHAWLVLRGRTQKPIQF